MDLKRRYQCWCICYPKWHDSYAFQNPKNGVISHNLTLNSLQSNMGVQDGYPLCQNSKKSTPNSQKRRQRPMSKIQPFFDVFINFDA